MFKPLIPYRFLSVFLLLILTAFKPAPTDINADILRFTNQFRRSNGLTPLQVRGDLNEIARKHSEDMAKGKCEFGHSGFDKRYDKIKKIFQSCTAAENVAYGANTGREVVEMWENSSGHRHNMLGKYTYVGIGTARDRDGTIYYTQLFVR
ncbi:MAG: CAP domain-containing protein [Chitinophagaceae bacterium]